MSVIYHVKYIVIDCASFYLVIQVSFISLMLEHFLYESYLIMIKKKKILKPNEYKASVYLTINRHT